MWRFHRYTEMRDFSEIEARNKSTRLVSALDQALSALSRHNSALLLFLVFCVVGVVGLFEIRDLQTANSEANNMYVVSVHGLRQIGELQYDAQETRRATLYALTTSDSNLQVEYADQTRDADQRVTRGIAEYKQQAKRPEELALAARLSRDWANYLTIRDIVLASILEGSTKEAVDQDLSVGVPSFERVRQDLTEVDRLYDDRASQSLANVAATSRRSAVKLIGILGFTFSLAGAAIWAIQRSKMLSAIQLAKLQMEFVASVSHELRTPLAAMSLAADNITDGLVEDKEQVQKYGAVIQNQSRQMAGLIDEILLFASTEDRRNRYVLRPLQVSQIVDAAVAWAKGLIQGTGFVLEQNIEADLPPVLGDLTAISQCLQNLIGNAVKYGGESRWIGLHAFTASSASGAGRELRISVSDRGIGIDASELTEIFDPFYRSPRIGNLQIHGTGLGLSLAKRIAEGLGGKISVVSELSVGSTFTLHLPTAEGEAPEMTVVAPQSRPQTEV
jgi:signal transduction histidine kinase